ncbi:MAG: TIGR01777 family oxidoreductase [Halopseudomonas sp.]|uniref:TIGR01777 family oxidoreductase n=1 Tax=Halopseudomonas sp. TaxID=2901191 RepID=UPI0030011A20
MNLLLTGGTGLIGRALCQRLLADGHQITVWSRRPDKVAALCGAQVRGVAELAQLDGEAFDAVVNLAGAPIADRPWTAKRKAVLWSSRVSLTEHLVQWIGRQTRKPEVMVSGSAVGWYGDGGNAEITEQSPARAEYTHTLCDAWEAAAKRVSSYGVRLCIMRTGLVVSAEGGFLARLKPPFKLGLGGPIGSGEQYMPWVHRDDIIKLIVWLLHSSDCKGAYNATAPHPVTNREFARELGRALGRPAVLPLPAFVLKLALGEMSRLLLTGQRALPAKAQAQGFRFDYQHLETALAAATQNK